MNNNEDDDEEDKTDTNFFTGGEKSALQVEDPNKRGDKKKEKSIIDQIFQRAKEQMDQPDERPSSNQDQPEEVRKFTGTGFKLGGENEPSEQVADMNSRLPKNLARSPGRLHSGSRDSQLAKEPYIDMMTQTMPVFCRN